MNLEHKIGIYSSIIHQRKLPILSGERKYAKGKDLDIDLSCHVVYTKQAKKAIINLLKKHYPDMWDEIFGRIQEKYVNYLKK